MLVRRVLPERAVGVLVGQKIVVDSGFVVDRVDWDTPNQPHSPNQPRKSRNHVHWRVNYHTDEAVVTDVTPVGA
jgi:hypothetical protein